MLRPRATVDFWSSPCPHPPPSQSARVTVSQLSTNGLTDAAHRALQCSAHSACGWDGPRKDGSHLVAPPHPLPTALALEGLVCLANTSSRANPSFLTRSKRSDLQELWAASQQKTWERQLCRSRCSAWRVSLAWDLGARGQHTSSHRRGAHVTGA